MRFGTHANLIEPGTLHSELSRLLADTTLTFWTHSDRISYLNRAYQRINAECRPLTKYVTIITAPSEPAVALPEDFLALEVLGVGWAADGAPGVFHTLRRQAFAEMDSLAPGWSLNPPTEGTPEYYAFQALNPAGNSLTLVPAPSESGVLKVHYVADTVDLVNSNDVPWGGLFGAHHHLIAYLAEVFARQKEQNLEAENQARGRYELEKRNFMSDLARQAPQVLQTVRRRNAYRIGFRRD